MKSEKVKVSVTIILILIGTVLGGVSLLPLACAVAAKRADLAMSRSAELEDSEPLANTPPPSPRVTRSRTLRLQDPVGRNLRLNVQSRS